MKERGAKAQVLVPLNLDGYLFSDKVQLEARVSGADSTPVGGGFHAD